MSNNVIRKDIKEFLNTIPSNVTLVAATKYISATDMRELFNAGVHNFGENRVDAFLNKYEELKDLNITWHFIGHLQRNKALSVINYIDYLHSLDSLKLARLINEKRTTPLNCFIEVSINNEENKNGVSLSKITEFVKEILKLPNIHLVGLMMMAVKSSNSLSLEHQFKQLRDLRDELEKTYQIKIPYLSMGMSDDYIEAIKEGATHIRLGRILYNL